LPRDDAIPDSHRDLLDQLTAVLATIDRATGLPQLTATSFFSDPGDGRLKISVNNSRYKTQNLRVNPAATLFIIDPANRLRTLEVRARADIRPDADFSFAARAGAKHGMDFHDLDGPGETRSVVTLDPVRVVAIDLSS
jgi:hypothetical protein